MIFSFSNLRYTIQNPRSYKPAEWLLICTIRILACCFFSLHNVHLNREKNSLPGRIAETGNIRWPMNFPPSSYTASLKHARVGKTT